MITIPEKGVHVNMGGPARLFALLRRCVRKAAGGLCGDSHLAHEAYALLHQGDSEEIRGLDDGRGQMLVQTVEGGLPARDDTHLLVLASALCGRMRDAQREASLMAEAL